MRLTRVLWLRHGQTAFNRERRLQGALPVPLDEAGRRQARLLGQRLQCCAVGALYASPRLRALETAQIVADELGLEVRCDERLAEIAFGDFEGRTFAEVRQIYPAAYRKWESGYRAYRVPGGESRLDVQRRMEAAWRDIVAADAAQTIAIVGHSSAMMIWLASVFAQLPGKPMRNCSITTLARLHEIWEIEAFGDAAHLDSQGE